MPPEDADIACDIRALLAARAAEASICPSEIARRMWSDASWRDAMPQVRRVACALAHDGVIAITQGDTVLDPAALSPGPIRLRRGPGWNVAGTDV